MGGEVSVEEVDSALGWGAKGMRVQAEGAGGWVEGMLRGWGSPLEPQRKVYRAEKGEPGGMG